MNPDKIRNILNIIFMLGTLASIIVYFAIEDKSVFLYVCGATLFCKMMEFLIRFTH